MLLTKINVNKSSVLKRWKCSYSPWRSAHEGQSSGGILLEKSSAWRTSGAVLFCLADIDDWCCLTRASLTLESCFLSHASLSLLRGFGPAPWLSSLISSLEIKSIAFGNLKMALPFPYQMAAMLSFYFPTSEKKNKFNHYFTFGNAVET